MMKCFLNEAIHQGVDTSTTGSLLAHFQRPQHCYENMSIIQPLFFDPKLKIKNNCISKGIHNDFIF